MQRSPQTPANWIAYRATVRFADGSIRAQHEFLYAADATPSQLMGRAYDIWSPARANCAGRFVDPTLTVEAVASDVREAA